MALGDGIRRNIAHVEPAERNMLRDAIIELHHRFYPGNRNETPPGGVSWWFKQDEIHQATHVHGGPEFLPWHRELTNRFENLLRQINPQLSLHYWDFKEDPRDIPSGNIGGGAAGTVNLFDSNLMGSSVGSAGDPWLAAGFYDPQAGTAGHPPDRDVTDNPVDPVTDIPRTRAVAAPGSPPVPYATAAQENAILALADFPSFRVDLESLHNGAHGYYANVSPHNAFRDPFVYLLHSNVDRIYAQWQTDPAHPGRLVANTLYGAEANLDVPVPDLLGQTQIQNLTHLVEPWSTGVQVTEHRPIRPWEPTHENEGVPHDYHDPSIVAPPCYDTNLQNIVVDEVVTPGSVINFNDVPTGETAARAAVFRIFACGDVTLQVSPGSGPAAPYSVITPGGSITAHHALTPYVEGRIWFGFTGGAPGVPVPAGSVTIHCVETGQDFQFTLHANSIARPTVAAMLCLDQSGSMDWLAGVDATTKRIDILHQAATNFVQLVEPNSGVGIVSFDHLAHPGMPVTRFTTGPFDLGRSAAITAIQNIHPSGATSIGNGLQLARSTLAPVSGYDDQALIVFTDGLENTSLFIRDVLGSINNRTYAIGLGTAQQVSTGALKALTNGTGGYLVLSGPLSTSVDDYFRLTKYFLQILAGVTNNSIVTDPSGYIAPGTKLRIPFALNETDIDSTVVLLTDMPSEVLNFLIETPAGDVMDPTQAAALGALFAVGTDMSYYRFTLPLPVGGRPAHEGTWYVLLDVDEKIFDRLARGQDQPMSAWSARMAHGVRYSVSAHALSNLRFEGRVSQTSLEPGATLSVRATLSEYGIPVDRRSTVSAELERPDGTRTTLQLAETQPGVFETSTLAAIQGVYRFRAIASGVTLRGLPFTREQAMSGAVVPGGDQPPPTTGPSTHAQDEALCQLLQCVLSPRALGSVLSEHKVDPGFLQECVKTWCEARLAPPTDAELAEREGTA